MAEEYIYFTTKDGEELANIDVSLLSRQEAHDLRYQLRQELIEHPEEFDEEKKTFYHNKIEELVKFLGTD
jgi:hypothetical protein